MYACVYIWNRLIYIYIYIYVKKERENGWRKEGEMYGKGEKTESIVNLDRCLLEREKNPIMRWRFYFAIYHCLHQVWNFLHACLYKCICICDDWWHPDNDPSVCVQWAWIALKHTGRIKFSSVYIIRSDIIIIIIFIAHGFRPAERTTCWLDLIQKESKHKWLDKKIKIRKRAREKGG